MIHGHFYKNKLNGPAFMKFRNGNIYESYWRHGKIDGQCFKFFHKENKWV
jgi:hypothetical protein